MDAVGLIDDLHADVVQESVHLLGLANGRETTCLQTGSGWAAEADAQMYLRQLYPSMLRRHGAIQKELQAALAELQTRSDLWNGAQQALSQAERLLPQLESLGAGKDFQGRISQVQQSLRGALDDQTLSQDQQAAQKLLSDMQAAQLGS